MVARLPKSAAKQRCLTSGLMQELSNPLLWLRGGCFYFFWKQMGLLFPPEQPIAGYCAAGRNNPLLFCTRLTMPSVPSTSMISPSDSARVRFAAAVTAGK